MSDRTTAHCPPASKSDLRRRILAQRDALSDTDRESFSARITTRLLELPAYRRAACVMAYLSFGSEFETARLVADLQARGKTLVLPRVERGQRSLTLHVVRDVEHDTESGVWGIRQPRADRCLEAPASQVGFVLVPGVAFTRDGARLGYGGGYYDRLIRGFTHGPALVAAAFELQMLDEIPMSDTDRRVDGVVTECAEYFR